MPTSDPGVIAYIMDPEIKELDRRMQKAAAELMELGDSVRLFITKHNSENGTTTHLSYGAGNWYAQESQVREWCMQNEERARAEVHADDDEE